MSCPRHDANDALDVSVVGHGGRDWTVFFSIREARLNKIAVLSMGLRVQEVAVVLTELMPAAEAAGVVSKGLEIILDHLRSLLEQTQDFVRGYGKEGFLARMLNPQADGHAIERLDRDIAAVIADLSVQLGVAQLRLQQRTFDEVNHLTDVLRSGQSSDAEVARLSGCSLSDAQYELHTCSEQLAA